MNSFSCPRYLSLQGAEKPNGRESLESYLYQDMDFDRAKIDMIFRIKLGIRRNNK
jgi:hypothetical protein